MNKKVIVKMLKESDMNRRYYGEMYNLSRPEEKVKYCQPYFSALADFEARTQMLLCFGYMIQRDENGEITGITKVKHGYMIQQDENGEITGITKVK